MSGYGRRTIWPAYLGSERISWYPVIPVLNTTSPAVSPEAPSGRPSIAVPSPRRRYRFNPDGEGTCWRYFILGNGSRIAKCSLFLTLGWSMNHWALHNKYLRLTF